jgi:hypothetical protein
MDDLYDLQLPTRACLRAACAFSYPTQVWLAHFMERDKQTQRLHIRLQGLILPLLGRRSAACSTGKEPEQPRRPSMCDVFVNQTLAVARVARVVEFQSEKWSVASNCCAVAHIHSCTQICTHRRLHAHTHACTQARPHARQRPGARAHTNTHVHTHNLKLHKGTHAHTRTHAHSHSSPNPRVHARIRTPAITRPVDAMFLAVTARVRVGRSFSLDAWNNNAPARKHALGELTAPSAQQIRGSACA